MTTGADGYGSVHEARAGSRDGRTLTALTMTPTCCFSTSASFLSHLLHPQFPRFMIFGLQCYIKKSICFDKNGCGSGLSGEPLTEDGHQWIGFDISRSMLYGPFCSYPLSAPTSQLLSLPTLKSTQATGEAMKGLTEAMAQINRQMNLPALRKVMREFEMQNENMEMILVPRWPRRPLKNFVFLTEMCFFPGCMCIGVILWGVH